MRLQQMVENLLLYDQVVIPTDNFVSIKVLADAFGTEGVATMIDSGILRFARVHGILTYAGVGRGLLVITQSNNQSPLWAPTGVAARYVFETLEGPDSRRAKQMGAKIASVTTEINLSHHRDAIQDRTFAAVRSSTISPELKVNSPNLLALPGQANNQLTLTGALNKPLDPDNDIGRVMRVARTESEIVGQQVTGCTDVSTLSPIGKIIAANAETQMKGLFQITDAPDIGKAALVGNLQLKDIIALRESKHWQEFVVWFHQACGSEPERVGREYVKLLKAAGPLDTTFFKVVRVLIPALIGLLPGGGTLSTAIGAADTFLLPKLKEPSPKYFIEELEQLTIEQRQGLAER